MTNWKHIRWEPGPDDDPDEEPYEYDELVIDSTWTLLIFEQGGRFYPSITHTSDAEVDLYPVATLEEAKQTAVGWMLQHIAGMLKACGAEGIWMARGANHAALATDYIGADDKLYEAPALYLEPPHELILLARFPEGDGREPGVQSL